jgi:hypothetical protein
MAVMTSREVKLEHIVAKLNCPTEPVTESSSCTPGGNTPPQPGGSAGRKALKISHMNGMEGA